MPALPFPENGADQSDRASGIRQLIRLGYEVRVIAKRTPWQSDELIDAVRKELKVPVICVPYVYSNKVLSGGEKLKKIIRKLFHPLFWDGAAMEYAEPMIRAAVAHEIETWRPDIVWFEYTYLWPLYRLARKKKIPIITRSANFEPAHFLQEDGRSLLNMMKYLAKYMSEFLIARWSDVVFAITPREAAIYRSLGAKRVTTLPLRGLSSILAEKHDIREHKPLQILFMGSTYSVSHNKAALRMVLEEIAPRLLKEAPDDFHITITGRRLPKDLEHLVKDNVTYVGFQDAEAYSKLLAATDIALIPSLFGAGMQQKIFEPLSAGVPTVTADRGLAGYPFHDGVSVLCASDAAGFISALLELRDVRKRKALSEASQGIARRLFSRDILDATVTGGIGKVCGTKGN